MRNDQLSRAHKGSLYQSLQHLLLKNSLNLDDRAIFLFARKVRNQRLAVYLLIICSKYSYYLLKIFLLHPYFRFYLDFCLRISYNNSVNRRFKNGKGLSTSYKEIRGISRSPVRSRTGRPFELSMIICKPVETIANNLSSLCLRESYDKPLVRK